MPDWSYHTALGPAIFALSPRGRSRLLRLLDAFGTSRAAAPVVEFVGHMRAPEGFHVARAGLDFPSPVGIDADLPSNDSLCGLVSRFGVGFVELGPVALEPTPAVGSTRLRRHDRTLVAPSRPALIGLGELEARLDRPRSHSAKVVVRLGHASGATPRDAASERSELIARLAGRAAFFTLAPPDEMESERWTDGEWNDHLTTVAQAASRADRQVLAVASTRWSPEKFDRFVGLARSAGLTGLWIGGGAEGPATARLLGAAEREDCTRMVARVRASWPEALIVAGGGMVEPADALEALKSGADMVAVDAGLVLSGPGLPKRINEALWARDAPARREVRKPGEALGMAWIAFALFGAALIASGLIAAVVAGNSVLLAYDERFLGMGRAGLAAINARLLPFLAHDRMALAGTTLSIGILYVFLAVQGLRSGAHWARSAITYSAIPGFASFFLYMGFGYLDVLDALGTTLLLCLFALGLTRPIGPALPPRIPDLRNDRAWLLSLWGQLGFVGLGTGFVVAGVTIATIGSTRVFVASDLEFLGTSASALERANDRLLSLIAHDRARFGGALVSAGVGVLLTSLWGVRRGARWVWWALALSGLPGFAAGLGIHAVIGYVDVGHLILPAVALVVYVVSLGLLWPYLGMKGRSKARARTSQKGRPQPS